MEGGWDNVVDVVCVVKSGLSMLLHPAEWEWATHGGSNQRDKSSGKNNT